MLGCCLIYFYFLWGKLSTRTVEMSCAWIDYDNIFFPLLSVLGQYRVIPITVAETDGPLPVE